MTALANITMAYLPSTDLEEASGRFPASSATRALDGTTPSDVDEYDSDDEITDGESGRSDYEDTTMNSSCRSQLLELHELSSSTVNSLCLTRSSTQHMSRTTSRSDGLGNGIADEHLGSTVVNSVNYLDPRSAGVWTGGMVGTLRGIAKPLHWLQPTTSCSTTRGCWGG